MALALNQGYNNVYNLYSIEQIARIYKWVEKCLENIKNNRAISLLQKNYIFLKKNRGCVKSVLRSEMVSGNSSEIFGPVVMEMASAKAKIRHVFGFIFFREHSLQ